MSAAQVKANRRRIAGRVVLYALVLLFTVQAAFPFAWSLITTFKTSPDLYSRDNNPFLFNDPPTLDHLRLLFQQTAFGTFVGNTVLISLCVVAITLLVAVPAAYSLARLGRRWGERMGI
ncbi:MAG: carbohydrate ABC transporter permease, partial [Actinomycetota bacterium]